MTSAEDTHARLDRIEAALQTLLERTAPKPRAEANPETAFRVNAFVALWNKHRGGLPEASAAKPGTKRFRDIAACLTMDPDLGHWTLAIQALASSRWHKGDNADGFIADIDFISCAKHRQKWLDNGKREYRPPTAVVPRLVPCSCGKQATVGPGTKQEHLADVPMCPGCFGA